MTPTNPLEYVFIIFTTLIGGGVQAMIIGSLSAVMATANRTEQQFRNQMDTINSSMRFMGLEDGLTEDVRRFFNFQNLGK
jgi:hypothetical protein